MARASNFSQSPFGVYLIFMLYLAAVAYLSEGWLQPDEHARVLEAAHQLVYGYASLPWELRLPEAMVSYLLGAIHAPILWLTKAWHLDGLSQAAWLRLFTAIVCGTQVLAMRKLLARFTTIPENRTVYWWIYLLSPVTAVLLVRTSQENWGTTALLWALVLITQSYGFIRLQQAETPIAIPQRWSALARTRQQTLSHARDTRATNHDSSPYQSFLIGVALSLAVSFRLQLGPSAAALGLYHLWANGRRVILPGSLGLLVGLLPMALVDYATYGTPFLPAYQYFHYALTDEQTDKWGTSGPWFYAEALLGQWYPPFSLVLLPLALYFCAWQPLLGCAFFPFLLAHLLLAHKEARYLSPMLPILYLATVVGWERMKDKWTFLAPRQAWARRSLAVYGGLLLVLGLFLALTPRTSTPRLYDYVYRQLEDAPDQASSLYYVANSMSGISRFYVKHPEFDIPKINFDELDKRIHQRDPWLLGKTLVVSRIDSMRLREWLEAGCHIAFDAENWSLRLIMRLSPQKPHFQRNDVVLRCLDDQPSS